MKTTAFLSVAFGSCGLFLAGCVSGQTFVNLHQADSASLTVDEPPKTDTSLDVVHVDQYYAGFPSIHALFRKPRSWGNVMYISPGKHSLELNFDHSENVLRPDPGTLSYTDRDDVIVNFVANHKYRFIATMVPTRIRGLFGIAGTRYYFVASLYDDTGSTPVYIESWRFAAGSHFAADNPTDTN